MKDYEGQEKEVEHALQMSLSEVVSEDPRFLEREPPPLSEEFPDGSKVFFLGEHAYGVAAQVQSTTDDSLSVVLAVRLVFYFKLNPLIYLHSSSHQIKPRMISSRALSIAGSPVDTSRRSRSRQ